MKLLRKLLNKKVVFFICDLSYMYILKIYTGVDEKRELPPRVREFSAAISLASIMLKASRAYHPSLNNFYNASGVALAWQREILTPKENKYSLFTVMVGIKHSTKSSFSHKRLIVMRVKRFT